MVFGHEKLDVYRLALQYVSWVFEISECLSGKYGNARDQLLRASQSIPLNIAEGNGKVTERDHGRYFEIARASALECAAIQDVLEMGNMITSEINLEKKNMLSRIVAMLTKLGRWGYMVKEELRTYKTDSDDDIDYDTDTDLHMKGV